MLGCQIQKSNLALYNLQFFEGTGFRTHDLGPWVFCLLCCRKPKAHEGGGTPHSPHSPAVCTTNPIFVNIPNEAEAEDEAEWAVMQQCLENTQKLAAFGLDEAEVNKLKSEVAVEAVGWLHEQSYSFKMLLAYRTPALVTQPIKVWVYLCWWSKHTEHCTSLIVVVICLVIIACLDVKCSPDS